VTRGHANRATPAGPTRLMCARRSDCAHRSCSAASESARAAGRDEHAVGAVANDLAIAGDVGRNHGRARRKRLGEDHPKALAAQRRRAQHVGPLQLPALGLVIELAQRAHAARVAHIRSSSSDEGPTNTSSAGIWSRSASNARRSTGNPLRWTGWPTNTIRRRSLTGLGAARAARSRSTCTPFGMIRQAPPNQRRPAPGPRRGLGYSYPDVQPDSTGRAPNRLATAFGRSLSE